MDILGYKAIFFDLDGTLVDTAKDIEYAINVLCDELSIQSPSLEQIICWLGNGTRNVVDKTVLSSNSFMETEDALNHANNLFVQIYRESIGEYCILYDGVKSLLVKLLANNIKLACITNKSLEYTDFMLQHNMISQFFSQILSADNSKVLKPDPWALFEASNNLSVEIKDCLMITGSDESVQAANSAGCDVLAVSFGYNHGNDIKSSNPDFLIHDYSEIIA